MNRIVRQYYGRGGMHVLVNMTSVKNDDFEVPMAYYGIRKYLNKYIFLKEVPLFVSFFVIPTIVLLLESAVTKDSADNNTVEKMKPLIFTAYPEERHEEIKSVNIEEAEEAEKEVVEEKIEKESPVPTEQPEKREQVRTLRDSEPEKNDISTRIAQPKMGDAKPLSNTKSPEYTAMGRRMEDNAVSQRTGIVGAYKTRGETGMEVAIKPGGFNANRRSSPDEEQVKIKGPAQVASEKRMRRESELYAYRSKSYGKEDSDPHQVIKRPVTAEKPQYVKTESEQVTPQKTQKTEEEKKMIEKIKSKGISLAGLDMCMDEFMEEKKKNNILQTIGDKKSCSDNGGEYIFTGTNSYASFNMYIIPNEGRKLLNRCKELENAYNCLKNSRKN
ncbi:MAG: hypothetical protein HY754_01605 [Nitrospirae bacterium]|nr:hypothetical protein [Nitrospirota bacterium]